MLNIFQACSNLASVTIPDGVTSIGRSAFENCSSVDGFTIPQTVDTIGAYAFFNCKGVLNVNCDIQDASYFDGPFAGSRFSLINIGNGVTSIGEAVFRNCSSVVGVTLPETIANIGISAFEGCRKLTNITCFAVVPPVIHESTFENKTYNYANLFIPENTKEVYQAATGWERFLLISDELPNGIQKVTNEKLSKIYDINGHELKTLQHGINIVDGRKVLISD